MGRLAQTDGLTEFEQDILATVRDFTNREIIPVATELEHRDEYPAQIVEGMKKLGLFGLTIGEEYGGLGASLLLYALVVEEIARGWMSVSGIINTHFIVAHMITRHGTDEQKDYFLPRMAAGDVRGAFSMSEPGLGSDVAAIRTKAVRDGDDFVLNGQKMWLTNGGTSNLVAVLCKTDDGQDAPHRNMTTFLIEKEPGFGPNPTVPGLTVPGKIEKMGYKGVDTTELILARRPRPGQPGPRRGHRPGLLPDDGRRGGGPGQRRRPRLRGRAARLRARHRLRADAAHLRPADRRAPGDRSSSWPRWRPRSRRRTR